MGVGYIQARRCLLKCVPRVILNNCPFVREVGVSSLLLHLVLEGRAPLNAVPHGLPLHHHVLPAVVLVVGAMGGLQLQGRAAVISHGVINDRRLDVCGVRFLLMVGVLCVPTLAGRCTGAFIAAGCEAEIK